MWQKEIYGILEIPADFSKDINRGEQAHVALFCDMGALLNYKALLQATSDVAITLGKEIQVENLPYASRIQQEITASPVEISEVKMFNPQSGFASFIIPAVLILVIQQSLLLGVGTIAGTGIHAIAWCPSINITANPGALSSVKPVFICRFIL